MIVFQSHIYIPILLNMKVRDSFQENIIMNDDEQNQIAVFIALLGGSIQITFIIWLF